MTRFRLLTVSLILLLAACLVYLAVDNVMQNRVQKSLLNQIEIARERLAAIPPVEADLTRNFSQAKIDNQKALALANSTPIGSTEIINILLKLAGQYNLVISPINTESWTSLSVGSTAYKMLPISTEIQGSLPDLITFAQKLGDANSYPYLIIRGLTIDDPLSAADITTAGATLSGELKLALIQRIPSQLQGESK